MTLQTSARILRPITRASTGVLPPACLSLASAARAETFALSILRRHSSAYVGVVPVDVVLRARPDATVANVFQMINTLTLHIDLVRQWASSERARGAGRSHPPPTFTLVGADHQRLAIPSGRAILERLFAREHRIETLVEREPPRVSSTPPLGDWTTVPGASVPASWSPRMEMVLRREVAATQRAEARWRSARDTAAATALGPTGPDTVRSAPFALSATPLSLNEMGRLTDEVVRTIDRRIIAQRERKGVI